MVIKTSLKTPAKPPKAKRIESQCSAHGVQWVYHYAWLSVKHYCDDSKIPAFTPEKIYNERYKSECD